MKIIQFLWDYKWVFFWLALGMWLLPCLQERKSCPRQVARGLLEMPVELRRRRMRELRQKDFKFWVAVSEEMAIIRESDDDIHA
jgi:hypothetical protein